MKRMGALTVACVAALTIACNNNTRTDNDVRDTAAVGTAGEADRSAVHDGDKDFINNQVSDGTAEVELGKLASERASNPEVKRFAQMLVQDHTKAGNELKETAAKHGIQPAPEVKDDHQDAMERLSKLRGAEFDREYINMMVDKHQDAVDALETRVDSTAGLKDRATNPDSANSQVVPEKSDNAPEAAVNAWAAKTLPTVRHHLDQARMLDEQLDRQDDNTTRNNRNKVDTPTRR
jgi:putative membrane protein